MNHHSTTDIQRDNMAYERNRLQLYQQSYTKMLRVIYGFLRAVYGWLYVVASGLRYLRIVTSYLRKNQSVDNRKKIFDMSKNLPLLSRILNSSCELLRGMTSYLWIQASYYRCL